MRVSSIVLQTSFLDKNIRLFQEVFEELPITQGDEFFEFALDGCEIAFIQGREPTLPEITLSLDTKQTLQDFAHRLQFIFYSQFGENYEPSVDLRKKRVTFYDFDGRIWHLEIRSRF